MTPWRNFLVAISGNSSIIIARLTCVRRVDPKAAAAAAAAAADVDAVQFDIVCRHIPKTFGSSSSSSIVCVDADAQVRVLSVDDTMVMQTIITITITITTTITTIITITITTTITVAISLTPASTILLQSSSALRHCWYVTSDGSCHVITATAAPAPSFSASSTACSSSSSSGGGGGTYQIATLPRCSPDTSRAAIYNGFTVTMWSYFPGGLVPVWTLGARDAVMCLSMCRVTCDADDDGDAAASHVTRQAAHVHSAGFAAVAASAGGGISIIVTVDAAAKQLLVRAAADNTCMMTNVLTVSRVMAGKHVAVT